MRSWQGPRERLLPPCFNLARCNLNFAMTAFGELTQVRKRSFPQRFTRWLLRRRCSRRNGRILHNHPPSIARGDEMFPTRKILELVLAMLVAFSLGIQNAPAQVKKGDADQDSIEKEQRRQTREQMVARWNKLRAFESASGKEKEIDRVPEPIFTFSEPTRETGHLGTLWVWGTKGRPVALLSQNKAYAKPVWGFELAALSEGVSVVMHDGWRWSPKSALKMSPFKNVPRAADSDARRLSQMKSLAQQFTVTEQYMDESFELRLLPSPIYRYQDEKIGLIDGALFNFAHETNPEALAVIECRKKTSGPTWSFGFLPLAGAGVIAKLDGNTVWTKEPTRESKSQELYSTWFETNEK